MLEAAPQPGATFLLNSPYGPDEVWDHLPGDDAAADHRQEAQVLRHRRLRGGQGDRHGRPHQHHHADLLLRHLRRPAARGGHRRHQEGHQEDLRQARRGGRAEELRGRRRRPWPTCTRSRCPRTATSKLARAAASAGRTRRTSSRRSRRRIIAGDGDLLPVSALPVDGTFPTGTAQWEKRNIALDIPVWDEQLCIQCGKCVLVCPHAAIRAKVYDPELLAKAPPGPSSRSSPRGRSSRT